MKIDPSIIDIIKSVIPAISGILGICIGARMTSKNTERTVQIQNKLALEQWQREKELEENRKIQDWFFEYAVEGCADILLAEIQLIQHSLAINAIKPVEKDALRIYLKKQVDY